MITCSFSISYFFFLIRRIGDENLWDNGELDLFLLPPSVTCIAFQSKEATEPAH